MSCSLCLGSLPTRDSNSWKQVFGSTFAESASLHAHNYEHILSRLGKGRRSSWPLEGQENKGRKKNKFVFSFIQVIPENPLIAWPVPGSFQYSWQVDVTVVNDEDIVQFPFCDLELQDLSIIFWRAAFASSRVCTSCSTSNDILWMLNCIGVQTCPQQAHFNTDNIHIQT